VERHQFIHGYGRERSLYNGKQHHNESTKQHNIYGITPFSIPIRSVQQHPIVTYDVSDIAVDMLPIPTDDGVYASFSSITLSVAGNMTYASRRLYGVRLVAVQHDHLESLFGV
jgi:hypothetical protein